MANITVTLLTNKRTRQSIDGLDTIVAAQAGGYSVISGEDNSTTFAVHYPETFSGQTAYVYMKNAKGEYFVKQFGVLSTAAEEFTLPASMTVEGNTILVFYASTGSGVSLVKTVWAPVVVPITATSVDYARVAVASPDTLAEVIATANLALTKATAVETAAAAGEYDGKSAFVRYSASPNGANMTSTWTAGQKYIGVYLGMSASSNPSDYTWLLFVGSAFCYSDSTTTAINYTVEDNTDKTFKASGITSIRLTIPSGIGHGYYAGVNVICGATAPTFEIVNSSSYDVKILQRGLLQQSYTPQPNSAANMLIYCDGAAVYVYVNEVVS